MTSWAEGGEIFVREDGAGAGAGGNPKSRGLGYQTFISVRHRTLTILGVPSL